jgi:uncharacterized membrane protein
MELTLEEPNASLDKEILEIREHVVQIEAVLIYLLLCIVALFLAAQSKSNFIVWAVAIVSLIGVRQVMRVRNPASRVRTRLLNISAGAATGVGTGLAVDTAFGFISLGAAAAIGGVVGGIAGAFAPIHENNQKKWLDWADAFKMLYERKEMDPRLANADKIKEVLDKEIQSFEFNPGIRTYALKDIQDFLRRKP